MKFTVVIEFDASPILVVVFRGLPIGIRNPPPWWWMAMFAVFSISVLILGFNWHLRNDCLSAHKRNLHVLAAQLCADEIKDSEDLDRVEALAQSHAALGHLEVLKSLLDDVQRPDTRAVVLNHIGRLENAQGKHEQAIEHLSDALNLYLESQDARESALAAWRTSYALWEKTRYHDALKLSEIAWSVVQKTSDDSLRWDIARLLFTHRYELGDIRGAELMLQKLPSIADSSNPVRWAQLRFVEGLLRWAQHRHGMAKLAFEQALEIARKQDLTSLIRSSRLNLTQLHLQLDELQAAQGQLSAVWDEVAPEDIHSALWLYQARVGVHAKDFVAAEVAVRNAWDRNPQEDRQWRLHLVEADIAQHYGNSSGVETALESAVSVLEKMRAQFGQIDEYKPWLQQRRRLAYERLFEHYAKNSQWNSAIATFNRLRAREVVDSLVVARKSSESLGIKTYTRLKKQLHEWRSLKQQSHCCDQRFSVLMKRFAGAEGLGTETAKAPVTPDGVQLRAYFITDSTLWILVFESDSMLIESVDVSRSELSSLVRNLVGDPDHIFAADALGKTLFPSSLHVSTAKRLLILADRGLSAIPFAALRVNGSYLIEDFEIAYLPHMQITRSSISERPAEYVWEEPVVWGAPEAANLAAAERELLDVANYLGVQPWHRHESTIGRLRTAHHASVLHIATHVGFDDFGPFMSTATGRLSSPELLGLGLAPRLVVLASCGGAIRPNNLQPEVWGSLAAVLLASGAQTVITTLNSIDDEDAHLFVRDFYDNRGVENPVEAIAKVQRLWIQKGLSAQRWASFVALQHANF